MRLLVGEDKLIWAYNGVRCTYSAKLGYASLVGRGGVEVQWWWRKLWKVKSP